MLIGVLHGKPRRTEESSLPTGFASLAADDDSVVDSEDGEDCEGESSRALEWRANMRLLLISFLISGLFTFAAYFVPAMRDIPVLGSVAASWLWTFNPSFACTLFPTLVGFGVILT